MRIATIGLAVAAAASAGCSLYESEVPVDGPLWGDAPITFTTTGYVANTYRLPASAQEAQAFGLDIDNRANDGIDNQLGTLIASLGSLSPGIDLNGAIAADVIRGELLLLLQIMAANEVGPQGGEAYVSVAVGADPQPPACNGPTDSACGRHLRGDGRFSIREQSAGPILGGLDRAGDFRGSGTGGATLALVMSLPDTGPFILPLHAAAAELHGVGPGGFGPGSKLGGAVRVTDLRGIFYPALTASFAVRVATDCAAAAGPPTCGCRAGSPGQQLLGFLDTNDNCLLTDVEVGTTMDQLLTPDIDLELGDGVNEAVSFGIAITGVSATYPHIF